MLLLIDNYDSFTYNLAQYLGELGATPVVKRNDEITLDEIEALQPERIVISPGPGRPEDAGISVEVIRRFGRDDPGARRLPRATRASASRSAARSSARRQLMHGKTSSVQHDGRGVFRGVSQPFVAGRYHSLVVAGAAAGRARGGGPHRRRHDHGRPAPHVSRFTACSSIPSRC